MTVRCAWLPPRRTAWSRQRCNSWRARATSPSSSAARPCHPSQCRRRSRLAGVGLALQPRRAAHQRLAIGLRRGEHRQMQFDEGIATLRIVSLGELRGHRPRQARAASQPQAPQRRCDVGETHQGQRHVEMRHDVAEHTAQRGVGVAELDVADHAMPVQVAEEHRVARIVGQPGVDEGHCRRGLAALETRVHHDVRRVAIGPPHLQAACDQFAARIEFTGLDMGPGQAGQQPGVIGRVMARRCAA